MIASGRQIAAARALIGWTRRDLAAAAHLHLNSVVYWEKRAVIRNDTRFLPVACRRIEQAFAAAGVVCFVKPAVGVRLALKNKFPASSRARARASWGATGHVVRGDNVAVGDVGDKRPPAINAAEPGHRICRAKTRRGTPCRAPAMKNGRCKLHGGLSTGARTVDGRRRVDLARAERWRKWRNKHRRPL